MNNWFKQQFEKEMRGNIKSLEDVLLGGNLENIEDYKKLVGKRQAYCEAIEYFNHLYEQMESN